MYDLIFFFADLKAFLEDAAKQLEKAFNSKCTFTAVSQVLMDHVGKMKETVEQMRANARQLCGEATIPLGPSPLANGKHIATLCQVGNINFSHKLLKLSTSCLLVLVLAWA